MSIKTSGSYLAPLVFSPYLVQESAAIGSLFYSFYVSIRHACKVNDFQWVVSPAQGFFIVLSAQQHEDLDKTRQSERRSDQWLTNGF